MDPESRYDGLCHYYRNRFNMVFEAPTRCTLRTEITGSGKRWSEPDRKFIWSLCPLAFPAPHPLPRPDLAATLSA
jgi:hypothetical protein